MNIAIDIRALSNRRLSGIGNYIYNSIKNIVEQDLTNEYWLFSSGLKDNISPWLDIKKENVHHLHYKIPNKLLHASILAGFGPKIVRKIPADIDLIWLPNLNFYKYDSKIPTVLTIHDLSFLHSHEFYSLKRRIWHKLINVRKLVNSADKIIAVSENTKRDIIRFFTVPEDKIKVINPGVSVTKMDNQSAKKLIEKFNLKNKYFIYVGTLEPRKNIINIIQAFDRIKKKYSDVDLVIVGSKGWVYRNVINMINKRDYIHYLNYVKSPEKDALYFLSQGLIWPSFYEGYGFPPLEATFHKVPVISSYKTSLPEIMKQQALYVDPYNVSDTYQLIDQLLSDKKLKNNIIQSAENFTIPDWSKQAKKILEILNNTNAHSN